MYIWWLYLDSICRILWIQAMTVFPVLWHLHVYCMHKCFVSYGDNIARVYSLQWRHNGRDGVSNHLFRRRSKKPSKLRVTWLCVGNSPVTGEFPAQMASNAYAENVSIWWRHHVSHHTVWINIDLSLWQLWNRVMTQIGKSVFAAITWGDPH